MQALKKTSGSARVDCDFARRNQAGAWMDVWPNYERNHFKLRVNALKNSNDIVTTNHTDKIVGKIYCPYSQSLQRIYVDYRLPLPYSWEGALFHLDTISFDLHLSGTNIDGTAIYSTGLSDIRATYNKANDTADYSAELKRISGDTDFSQWRYRQSVSVSMLGEVGLDVSGGIIFRCGATSHSYSSNQFTSYLLSIAISNFKINGKKYMFETATASGSK